MKNKVLFTSLLFFAANAFSQPGSKIKFGIKLGVALAKSKLEYPDNSSYKFQTKSRLIAGGYVDFGINKDVVFQPALLYVRKGVRETTQSQYNYGSNVLFNYLEIPLNILYSVPAKKGNYFIGGGLSPAIKLNNYLYGDELKSVDLGVNLLAGYKFSVGFSINIGYTYGLLNVSNNKEYASKIQNKYFSLAAGYEF